MNRRDSLIFSLFFLIQTIFGGNAFALGPVSSLRQMSGSIAIAGATGDLGQALTRRLLLDNRLLQIFQREQSQLKEIEETIDRSQTFFYLAGKVGLSSQSQEEIRETLFVNGFAVGITSKLIEARNRKGKIRFIYPSSHIVYTLTDHPEVDPWIENAVQSFESYFERMPLSIARSIDEQALRFTDEFLSKNQPPKGANIYAVSKKLGEAFAAKMENSVIVRIGDVYGPSCGHRRLLGRMIHSRISVENLAVPEEKRAFVHIDDVTEILQKLSDEKNPPKVLDLTTGLLTSTQEVIKQIQEETPYAKGTFRLEPSLRCQTVQNSNWARHLLGRDFISFKAGLRETVRAFSHSSFAEKERAFRDKLWEQTKENLHAGKGFDEVVVQIVRNNFVFSSSAPPRPVRFMMPTGVAFPASAIVRSTKFQRVMSALETELATIARENGIKEKELVHFTPEEALHATILSYSYYKDASVPFSVLPKEKYPQAQSVLERYSPFQGSVEGIIIAPDGSIITTVVVDHEMLDLMREELIYSLKIPPKLKPQQAGLRITLGRFLTNPSFTPKQRDRLIKIIDESRNEVFGEVSFQQTQTHDHTILKLKSLNDATPLVPYTIVFDIGGTHFRAGVLDPHGHFIQPPQRFNTPNFIDCPKSSIVELQEKLVTTILHSIEEIKKSHPTLDLSAVGISFAGPIGANGTVKSAATLWGNRGHAYPLLEELQKRAPQLKWVIANDITAAAARYGRKKEYAQLNRIAVITVSSGIGHKVFDIRSQQVLLDSKGAAGEMGHVQIDFSDDALPCDCGGKGHLMAYASGRAAERVAKKLAKKEPTLFKNSLVAPLAENDMEKIKNYYLAQAAKENDPFALSVLREVTLPLAREMSRLYSAIGIDRFVIMGGFATGVGEPYLQALRTCLVETGIFGLDSEEISDLVELGYSDDDDGLIGIGLLAQNHFQHSGVQEGEDALQNAVFDLDATRQNQYRIITTQGVFNESNPTLVHYVTDKATGKKKKIFVAVDENVFRLYSDQIRRYFEIHNFDFEIAIVRSGEANKISSAAEEISAKAKAFGLGRDDYFIAVGGGVVMDIVGHAAAQYRRGIPYIRIPTTLLGIVDAGIGVKVGVNFMGNKNFLGAFYPPSVVINDENFLQTVEVRQIRSGIAEMIKIALVANPQLFLLLERNYQDLLDRYSTDKTKTMIKRAIAAMIIGLQPNLYEGNLRRLEDFGHPFAHVIETASHYAVTHGEAVALDMLMTTYIAAQRGVTTMEVFERVYRLINNIELFTYHPSLDPDILWAGMADAIAHRGGNLNMVLPQEVGKATFTNELTQSELKKAIFYLRSRANPTLIKGLSAGDLRVEFMPVPEAKDGEMVIEVLLAGVCGADLKISNNLRDHQPGVIGHEAVVQVAQVGKSVKGFHVGDRLVLNPNDTKNKNNILGYNGEGLFRRYLKLTEEFLATGADRIFKIPVEMETEKALFVEPLSCVVHAQNRIKKSIKDKTILVAGTGPMGFLHARLAKVNEASKVFMINRSDENPEKKILELTDGERVDVLILAAPFLYLEKVLPLVVNGGTVLIYGSTNKGDTLITKEGAHIDMHQLRLDQEERTVQLQDKSVRLVGSYGALKPDFEQAIQYLHRGKIRGIDLISHIVSIEEAPHLLKELSQGKRRAFGKWVSKVVIQMKSQSVFATSEERFNLAEPSSAYAYSL